MTLDSLEQPAPFPPSALIFSMLFFALGSVYVHYLITLISEKCGQSYITEFITSFNHNTFDLSLKNMSNTPTGSMAFQFVNDLSEMKKWVSHGIPYLIYSTTTIVLCMFALWLLHPLLALAAAVPMGITLSSIILVGAYPREYNSNNTIVAQFKGVSFLNVISNIGTSATGILIILVCFYTQLSPTPITIALMIATFFGMILKLFRQACHSRNSSLTAINKCLEAYEKAVPITLQQQIKPNNTRSKPIIDETSNRQSPIHALVEEIPSFKERSNDGSYHTSKDQQVSIIGIEIK
ncbi:hypothetical protein [Marinibactrum halimedae]|uniref:ABC transmembrane type-1 domain-containing protein n=1 Tax=Marinibactrum halimedae TaxID=1444977 RepID=A0AA37WQ57_9GAMM|nr:hypothetical protein [Marinibactrum halimedae]MCD9461314.1 hypothetical protein [Marinibactrum halimedae]GLS27681.1 hypothetical protein GCM10007877_34000 [Marinibactrum halimedae]